MLAQSGNVFSQAGLSNIVEAFKETIARYKEQGVDVPWLETPIEPGRGAMTRVVIVRV